MPHILVVEDHPEIRDVMQAVLQAQGYRVTCAPDGQEAFIAFEHEPPDLIVSDVLMPKMDGFALLQAVRAHPAGSAVPFMFLSARHEATATSQARLLGADDYLFKPFTPEELTLAVRTKLDRRRATQRFDTHTAHLQTVLMLANVIEARDQYTRGHVERVQHLARALAEALGWDLEALTVLEYGAVLHDIGKILVPRAILNKSKRLGDKEWAVMRQHPETGAHMLAGVDHLRAAVPYVLFHHERWDGGGYPAGLAGTNIPLEGRLLAIVDTYDAITSDRAYRRAAAPHKALAEIRRRAGSQFDPDMTEVFVRLREAEIESSP